MHETRKRGGLAALCLCAALAACGSEDDRPVVPVTGLEDVIVQDRFEVTRSPYGERQTLTRLYEALDRRELTVFATIDHAAAARGVGAEMPPATLVIFGDPAAGTPLMREVPLMAIELPLRALVFEEDGRTFLALTGTANLSRTYPLGAQEEVLGRVGEALDAIGAEVTGG